MQTSFTSRAGAYWRLLALAFFFSTYHLDLLAADCCRPPDDVVVDCDELPRGFDPTDDYDLQELFGIPSRPCSGSRWAELTPEVNLNTCDVGHIIRTFEVYDRHNKKTTCTQRVDIEGVHDYMIRFPKDVESECTPPYPDLVLKRENGCDLLAINSKDEYFGNRSSSCYKVLRTYKIINWCEYDGESPPVVIGRDEDCNGEPGDHEVWVIRRPRGKVYLDLDDDRRNNVPSSSSNECYAISGYLKGSSREPRLTPTGFWQYTQHLKVFDNSRPTVESEDAAPFCSLGNDCKAEVSIQFSVDETCSADYIQAKVFFFENGVEVPLNEENNIAAQALSGSFPDYQLSGRYPIGEHIFEVHLRDGCGNSGIAKIPFSVIDCKAPAPICHHGVSTSLLALEAGTDADGDGDVDEFANVIWVSDLLRSEISDCTEPITYSINRVGETPDPERRRLVLTCEDLDTVRVEVYAWDAAFNPEAIQPDGSMGGSNYDHCETYIAIRPGSCSPAPPPAHIFGKIKTFSGTPIEEVQISLTGGMQMAEQTDTEGAFSFDVQPAETYWLTPAKETYFMDAVNTADVVALNNHITGRKKLDNPYQLIAADIDNSGKITILDLVYLRKAVLGDMDAFPNNKSWRFVPASHVFSDPTDPWSEPFPEQEYVDHMDHTTRWAHFYAIKVGDIDDNIGELYGRSMASEAYLTTSDDYLRAGETYRMNFKLTDAPLLEGLQFELFFDPSQVAVEAIKTGGLSVINLGADLLREGKLAVSWNQTEDSRLSPDGDLFSVDIRPRLSGYLRDMLQLNERRILSEGYSAEGDIHPIRLQFSSSATGRLRLEQNYPNPFREFTQIRFDLPETGPVRLEVFDLNGRSLYRQEKFLEQGEHLWRLTRSDFEQTGLMIYVLEANGRRLSRKMLKLE